MKLKDYSTEEIVEHCLNQCKEGDYWNFKQEWHHNMEDLIKDIICFANTVHDEKCYLIFGISDGFKVVGMSERRLRQADIIDALSYLQFAGDVVPQISVETICIQHIDVDVLIIDNVERTPVYLKKDYGKMKRGCIYARVQDRNTPNNDNAEIGVIENLWRKRLGLTKSPYEYIMDRLQNQQEWAEFGEDFYNIYKLEFRIHRYKDPESDELVAEFYAYTQADSNVSYSMTDIIASNTVMDSYQIVHLDGGRLSIPVPEWGYIPGDKWNHEHCSYKNYVEDSNTYRLLKFMYDPEKLEQKMAYKMLMKVVLLFKSEEERKAFES